MPRRTKLVDSVAHPIFGVDTEELVLLRKFQKLFHDWLAQEVSEADLIEADKEIRKVQRKTRRQN